MANLLLLLLPLICTGTTFGQISYPLKVDDCEDKNRLLRNPEALIWQDILQDPLGSTFFFRAKINQSTLEILKKKDGNLTGELSISIQEHIENPPIGSLYPVPNYYYHIPLPDSTTKLIYQLVNNAQMDTLPCQNDLYSRDNYGFVRSFIIANETLFFSRTYWYPHWYGDNFAAVNQVDTLFEQLETLGNIRYHENFLLYVLLRTGGSYYSSSNTIATMGKSRNRGKMKCTFSKFNKKVQYLNDIGVKTTIIYYKDGAPSQLDIEEVLGFFLCVSVQEMLLIF